MQKFTVNIIFVPGSEQAERINKQLNVAEFRYEEFFMNFPRFLKNLEVFLELS